MELGMSHVGYYRSITPREPALTASVWAMILSSPMSSKP